MPKDARTLSLLLALASVGCGPAVQSMNFVPSPQPATPSDYPIRIYGEAKPECEYREIGGVSSQKKNGLVSMERVMEGLRERARKMGGHAIIGTRFVGSAGGDDNDPVVSGTVIRFDDPTCTR